MNTIYKNRKIYIWFFASLFFTLQMMLRVIPSFEMENILIKYSIDMKQFGIFAGLYYLGYALIP